jgi:23S rRNA pseudouridine1911/1915/1917 synthase
VPPDADEHSPRRLELVVEPAEAALRVDKFLVQRVPELGRRAAARLFEEGHVKLAGRRAKKGDICRAGERVEVELSESVRPAPDPSLPLDVRLETPDLVVVSKPAGMPCVPVPGSTQGTLASALLARYPEMDGIGYGPREPGLVHRLDTETSGLLVAARTAPTFAYLKSLLTQERLFKRYLAIVESRGLPGAGLIDAELMPDPRDSRRMRIATQSNARGVRPAQTRWRTVQRAERFALVEVEVHRALRHQIRVHLASIGHPIVGDALYGGTPVAALGKRHALHASHLAWEGDQTLQGFAVEDALPEDLSRLLVGA